MKVTFSFDDGTEVSTKPENLVINNQKAGDVNVVVVGYKTGGGQIVPALTFVGHYFSPDGYKEHDALVAKAVLEAATKAQQKTDAPTADANPAPTAPPAAPDATPTPAPAPAEATAPVRKPKAGK